MTAWRARATPALLAAPKPGLSGELDDLGAARRGRARRPSSAEPVSTTTSCGARAGWRVEARPAAGELGGRVVQDGDDA